MKLLIIAPNGREMEYVIEDWEPTGKDNEEQTDILLMCYEFKESRALASILEYHSIKPLGVSDWSVAVKRPDSLKITPNTLTLDYSK